MREQYPFFRDGDEQTQAVIGEEAVNADLDGDYQKPYAVLTQKRLYCKNEQGNFITDASALRSADKGLLPGQNWFLWAVVACVSLVLVLLCLWYWGLGGRWRTENISYDAQSYIDNYQALEEKIPEYEQMIKDYEDAEKEIKQLQQQLEDMDHNKIMQEASKVFQEEDRLQAAFNEAAAAKNDQQQLINSIEDEIAGYNQDITETEDQIKNLDAARNNEIKAQIDSLETEAATWRKWKNAKDADFSPFYYRRTVKKNRFIPDTVESGYTFDGQDFSATNLIRAYCSTKLKETQTKLSDLYPQYIDVDGLQIQIGWDKQYISESEAYLAEQQKQLSVLQAAVDAAKAEKDSYQPTVKEAREKANKVESLQAKLAQSQSALDGAALANARNQIQQFEDSKPGYKNAQSVQRKVKLFLPCLLAFAACVVASIILAARKRTKPAVAAALASAFVGLACAFLSNINLPNIQGFGWGDYYIMPPPLSVALRVLPVLAILLAVLALWWNRKKTVFQIVHNTGAFSFTPSVYPAEELRQFTEQVQIMREGETDGE